MLVLWYFGSTLLLSLSMSFMIPWRGRFICQSFKFATISGWVLRSPKGASSEIIATEGFEDRGWNQRGRPSHLWVQLSFPCYVLDLFESRYSFSLLIFWMSILCLPYNYTLETRNSFSFIGWVQKRNLRRIQMLEITHIWFTQQMIFPLGWVR